MENVDTELERLSGIETRLITLMRQIYKDVFGESEDYQIDPDMIFRATVQAVYGPMNLPDD